MLTALAHCKILGSEGWLEGHAVLIEGDTISGLVPDTDIPAGTLRVDLGGHTLLSGFIDVQVNGGGGVLFNDQPTLAGIKTITAAHRAFGTTGMLPTLISDDLNIIESAIAAVEAAIREGVPGILGIHIEGPFLSQAKKGAHNADKFRTLDDDAVRLLSSLKGGITLVTLAPEETTPAMIQKLVAAGVIVSAGHTNATCAEARAGLDAGITGFTHLYNAMRQMTAREPGVVGAALADKASFAGIIADGHHVSPASLKAAIRAKGLGHIMLVTDAMPSVGAAQTSFTLAGAEVRVSGGKCTLADGMLAGSNLDMASALRNARDWLGTELDGAVRMASSTPAAFLGISSTHGSIEVGKQANFVVIDNALNVRQTWINGRGD
jgi:N-acetylglucosamine-6-phosphate deacetylase